jgi:hypothetical protein
MSHRIVVAHLKSNAPYSQSRFHQTEKLEKETPEDYEKRTWREKAHFTTDSRLFIPPMCFKNCISEASAFLGERIKGKGQATWRKHFLAGLQVFQPLVLPIRKDDVPGEWVFCNADGKKGSGTRVMRCFPVLHEWEGNVLFHLFDDAITKDVFERHLREAGNFIGIGRFRCINGGFYGRFMVESLAWEVPAST